ncbi:hypothetical protein [Nostoc sp.]
MNQAHHLEKASIKSILYLLCLISTAFSLYLLAQAEITPDNSSIQNSFIELSPKVIDTTWKNIMCSFLQNGMHNHAIAPYKSCNYICINGECIT